MWLAGGALALSAVVVASNGPIPALTIVWGALGAMALWDFVSSLSNRPAARVDGPVEVFVGEHGHLTLETDREIPGLDVAVDWPEGLRPSGDLDADPDKGMYLIPFSAIQRGTWEVAAVWMRWPSRLGMFEMVPKLKPQLAIGVVPDIRPVQSGEITVKVRSELYGVKENNLIGEGSEFHQLRDFVPGMDIRSIDWKQSARHRALVAKDMRAERNHHLIVCVDSGRLMREEIGGYPKIDHAINAALAIAWASAIGGDLTGFYSYDAKPRIFSPPEPGRLAFARIRSLSAQVEYASVEANHTLALAELSARTPRRSLLVFFSDFVDSTTAELLVENLSILAKRHAIVFVAIRDPEAERTEDAPDTLDDVAQTVVAAQTAAERRRVMEDLARLGIMVLDCKPGTVTARVISAYLDLKAREII